MAILSVCVGIDWDLSKGQVASMASIVFVGELVGSLLWSVISRHAISISYQFFIRCPLKQFSYILLYYEGAHWPMSTEDEILLCAALLLFVCLAI